jgi:hypothetical protein
MKSSILFLVHCEEAFRVHFPDKMFPLRLRRACQARKYDRVIALESKIDNDNVAIQEITDVVTDKIDFGWGYEPECFDQEEKEFVIPTKSCHEYTWIPPEIRNMNLKNYKVFVGGGCESECLQDFLDILTHLGIDYQKVKGYIF